MAYENYPTYDNLARRYPYPPNRCGRALGVQKDSLRLALALRSLRTRGRFYEEPLDEFCQGLEASDHEEFVKASSRELVKATLREPIRSARGDSVEDLNGCSVRNVITLIGRLGELETQASLVGLYRTY
jgi:hypothetical protein